jgi:hypothetical protein
MTLPNDASDGTGNPTSAVGKQILRVAASFAGPALVAVLFVLLAALTWRKWADCFVDFGVQLYIPWRINQGDVLYRDLFYMSGGPLSQYFNALLFKILGVSFSTLIWANLAFAAALVGIVYRRFRAASNALTATILCLGLVSVFIFANYTTIGNYNYIAPYTHDTVHGVFLSILVIGLLADWLIRPRLHLACLAGLGAGLVFLTKPDIFVALMVTAAIALGMGWFGRPGRRFPGPSLTGFAAAFLLPPLCFFLLFLRVENWRDSLHSVVFGWVPLFRKVPHNVYYSRFSGLDHPVEHLRQMAGHFLCAGLLIAAYTILFRRLGRWTPRHLWWRWPVWLVLILPLLAGAWRFEWTSCGASLPLWCVAVIACLAWRLRIVARASPPASSGGVPPPACAPQFIYPLLWTVFALMMTAKMGVFCRVWHYGFVLAMPASLAAMYFLMWLLPGLLEERCQVPAKFLRAAFLPVLLVGFLFLWGYSEHMYSLKRQTIGSGGDRIVTFGPGLDVGDGVKAALDWMNQNLPPNATLAVVPSGVTLNYLTRRVNPTPCLFWDPNLLAVYGTKEMTARFEARPPDYVLLAGGNHDDWDIAYFGSDPRDGAEVMDWIRKNYRAVCVIGREPLRDRQFGLEFLKYAPPPGATAIAPNH